MRWPVILLALLLWQGSAAPVLASPPEDDVVAMPRRVAVLRVPLPLGGVRGVREDAGMMVVGAALIALASLVRRAA
jgi:hypothetical protein